MPITVTGPDGGTIDFPDGTDDATINKVMAQAYGGKGQTPTAGAAPQGPSSNANGQPPQPNAPPQLTNDAGTGFATGFLRPYDNAAAMADRYIPGMHSVDEFLAGATGTPNVPIGTTIANNAAAAGKRPDPVASFVGNVAGSLPISLVTRNPWLGGALSGALNTNNPTDPASVATDAATGAIGGKALQVVGNRVAGVVNPIVRPYLQRLQQVGMDAFTPGQLVGGTVQTLENSMRSAPFIGDAIHAGQKATLSDFNTAAYNDALKDIGQSVPKGIVGHDAATFTQKAISAEYERILPTLRIQADTKFRTDMQDLATEVKEGGLPAEKKQQFFELMQGYGRRFSGSGGMTGRTMGEVDSLLGQEYATYRGSPNPDDQKFAKYLLMAQANFRDMVVRANPGRAAELRGMRSAWAKFVPVELAAGSPGTTPEGFFQPQQLKSAAAQNATVRQMAQGNARAQQHAEAGQGVLGQVPENPNRLLFNLGGTALGLATHANPVLAIPAAAFSAMYSPAGRRLLTSIMTGRQGPVASAAGKAIRTAVRAGAGPVGGVVAPKRIPPQPAQEEPIDLGVTGR